MPNPAAHMPNAPPPALFPRGSDDPRPIPHKPLTTSNTTASHRPIAPIATSPEADLHAGLLASRKVSLHLAPHRVPSVAENSQTIPIQAKTPTALDPKAHEIQRGLFSNTNEFLRLHS
jgi:hypothetical protein